LMWSVRDPSIRKSGNGNVFIKNLHAEIDNQTLYDTFSQFGNILSCKVALNPNGQSRGYGFVHFESDESAKIAIEKVNGMLMNGNKVFVSHFVKRSTRIAQNQQEYKNCYVKSLRSDITADEFKTFMETFGKVTSVDLKKDKKSRVFGFVEFDSHEEAVKACNALHEKHIDELCGADNENVLYCQRAQKKAERQAELKKKFQVRPQATTESGLNLYIKNLDETFNDAKLRELFEKFGEITSCKVMTDDKAVSDDKSPPPTNRGFGFVSFKTIDSANRAIAEMNNFMVNKKPLYVGVAQRKEARRAALEYQSHQRRGLGPAFVHQGMNSVQYPVMDYQTQFFNHPFYNKLPPRGMPQQRPPFPQAAMLGGGRGGRGQPMPRGRGVGGRGVQFGMNKAMLPNQIQPPVVAPPTEPLTPLVLAQMTPDQQKNSLGERLYSRISETHPGWAAKVTGMLLEMDISEQLNLLESPELLKAKINEALDVLRTHST
jgi:polyadenylate-binding protein